MNTRFAVPFLALTLAASLAQAQAGGPNANLIGQLQSSLGITHEQAEGAAGAVFAAAKSNMDAKDWSLVTDAIHGVDGMISKVPHKPDSVPMGPESKPDSAIRGISSVTGAFTRLGIPPDKVTEAAKIVGEYVTRNAGPDTGKAFTDALH